MKKQITAVYVSDETRLIHGGKRLISFGLYGARGKEYGGVGPWSEDPIKDKRSQVKFKRAVVEKVGCGDIEIKVQ